MTTHTRGPAAGTAPPSVPVAAGPTDSRGSGGSPAGQPAPGVVAPLAAPSPAAGHRAYALTTRGWIAALCASAEPFDWPDRAP